MRAPTSRAAQNAIPEQYQYPLGKFAGKVWAKPGADAVYYAFVHRCMTEPGFWHANLPIMNETTQEFQPTEPSDSQLQAELALIRYRRVLAWKYRQAMFSTVGCNRMLLECMYLEGVQGVIIANTDIVARELMRRINDSYAAFCELNPALAVPLRTRNELGSKYEIVFAHGGKIQVLSAEGRAPGISFSPSRLMISEAGEMSEEIIKQLFRLVGPSIVKKPGMMIFIESTPGEQDGFYYRLCMSALAGENSYFPFFAKWWLDKNARRPVPANFVPTERELAQIAQYAGLTFENLQFLREFTQDFCDGDARVAENPYPWSPGSGWRSPVKPALPQDVFNPLVAKTLSTRNAERSTSGCYLAAGVTGPKANAEYLICVDPKEYGVQHQWGLSVFEFDPNAVALAGRPFIREVGWYMGKGDPLVQRDMIISVCTDWVTPAGEKPLLVVENNKTGTLTGIRNYGIEHPSEVTWRLWGVLGANTPGWTSSQPAKDRAIATYVAGVASGGIEVSSQEAVLQALRFNREKGWALGRSSGGDTHHFDLLITHFIAADVGRSLGWVLHRPPAAEKPKPVVEPAIMPLPGVEPGSAEDLTGYSMSERELARLLGRPNGFRWK